MSLHFQNTPIQYTYQFKFFEDTFKLHNQGLKTITNIKTSYVRTIFKQTIKTTKSMLKTATAYEGTSVCSNQTSNHSCQKLHCSSLYLRIKNLFKLIVINCLLKFCADKECTISAGKAFQGLTIRVLKK